MNNQLLEQVTTQVDAWAHNRQLYPGWIAAPNQSRETLWSFTHTWIDPVLAILPGLRPEQRLRALDELNWRIERALVPLFTNIVDAMTGCLEDINPFPGSLDLPKSSLSLSRSNADSINWAETRRIWLCLAFAILRFQREERQLGKFEEWAGRLRRVVDDFPDATQHLCYERALVALGNMDDTAVGEALDAWPTNSQDTVWELRRAAILTEIGRLREAEVVAESALSTLRVRAKRGSDDISSFSREGWAMLLLLGLKQHGWLMGRGARPDFRGRWEQLRRYHCNPWDELELLESKLDQPAPRPRPRMTNQPGFHPGTYTRSYHGGSDLPKILPAYQFMRLTEDAPRPPRCGNTTLSEKALEKTAEWFARQDAVRTVTLTCRLASTEVIGSFLRRHGVAALPMPTIEELSAISVRAAEGALGRAQAAGAAQEAGIGERAHRQLLACLDILARVSVRLPSERLGQLLTLAIKLYQSPVVRSSVSLPDKLRDLFKSVMLAMRREDLEARFLELLLLPVPGSASFPVAVSQRWPEILREVGSRLTRVIRIARSAEWPQAVTHLLEAADDQNWEARSHAMGSLLELEEWGCLTSTELRRLGKLLWARVSQQTGLPDMPGVLNFVYLSLPEPRKGLALERFRKYLRDRDLQRFCHQAPGADGTPRRVFTGYVYPDIYLVDWLGATAIPVATRAGRRGINWSKSDAALLFRKMHGWWVDEGRDLIASPVGSPFMGQFGDQPPRDRIDKIFRALTLIVIPRTTARSSLATEVIGLVDEIDAGKVPVESVLPVLIQINPGSEKAIASRLRRALATHDEDRQRAALNGLTNWLQNQAGSPLALRGLELPRVPEDLLQELGSRVANRRQPGLRLALGTAISVLRSFPERANRRFVKSLTLGLDYLLAETQYRMDDDSAGQIPAAETPTYRLLSARLAAALSRVSHGRSAVTEQWLEAARQDPLPEVRQAVEYSAESNEGG